MNKRILFLQKIKNLSIEGHRDQIVREETHGRLEGKSINNSAVWQSDTKI